MVLRHRDPLLGIKSFAKEFWPLLTATAEPKILKPVQEPVEPPLGYSPPDMKPEDYYPYDEQIIRKPPGFDSKIIEPRSFEIPERCTQESVAAADVRIKNHEADEAELQRLSSRLVNASEAERAKLPPLFEKVRARVEHGRAAHEADKKYLARCAPRI